MEAYRHLFTPLRLGPVTVANRIVFAAHLINAAVDGLPAARHAAYAAARAAGGAGLVVTGLTPEAERWHVRAAELGTAQTADRVVTGVTAAGRLTVRLLHHPTGAVEERVVDWVVVAAHGAPADELWRALAGGGPEVHRIGDCLAPRRAHAATVEGERVGAAL